LYDDSVLPGWTETKILSPLVTVVYLKLAIQHENTVHSSVVVHRLFYRLLRLPWGQRSRF
jgi:hypothetical protein